MRPLERRGLQYEQVPIPSHPPTRPPTHTLSSQQLQYVIDFDARFHILVGEAGTTPATGAPLSSQALVELLQKRLEYFGLADTVCSGVLVLCVGTGGARVREEEEKRRSRVRRTYTSTNLSLHMQLSLFLLRFPPETLFELEDIAMDAAMDSFDDDPDAIGSSSNKGGGDRRGERGQMGPVDEEGMGEEGVDLRLMGQLVPRFLGKVRVIVSPSGRVCVCVWVAA